MKSEPLTVIFENTGSSLKATSGPVKWRYLKASFAFWEGAYCTPNCLFSTATFVPNSPKEIPLQLAWVVLLSSVGELIFYKSKSKQNPGVINKSLLLECEAFSQPKSCHCKRTGTCRLVPLTCVCITSPVIFDALPVQGISELRELLCLSKIYSYPLCCKG